PRKPRRPQSQCSSSSATQRYQHHRHRREQPARHHRNTGHKMYNTAAEVYGDNVLTTVGQNRVPPLMDATPRNSRLPPHIHHTPGRSVRPPFGIHSKSNEPLIDLLLEQKLSQIKCTLSESDSNNSYKTNSLTKKYNYNSATNSKPLLNRKSSAISDDMTAPDDRVSAAIRRTTSDTTVDTMSRTLTSEKMYSESTTNGGLCSGGAGDKEDLHSRAILRAIVGYLGTIETPVDSHIDANLIKDCIRRIRVENKHQTTTLLAIYQESIQLVNIRGRTIAQFAADSLK
ncbi:unnamed protein product, partial [Medioppia subpectinata]